jgi:hypothetical protein
MFPHEQKVSEAGAGLAVKSLTIEQLDLLLHGNGSANDERPMAV